MVNETCKRPSRDFQHSWLSRVHCAIPGHPIAFASESQSAPAWISRMKRSPRSVPAKRQAKDENSEAETTCTKHRRVSHPYAPSAQATTTPFPLRRGVAAFSIPSPLPNLSYTTFINTDSMMSLSELTSGRPPKRVCAPLATRHELSSSGRLGALAHAPPPLEANSAGDQDVEMVVLDGVEVPQATMSSPDLGDWDEWVHSAPPTPILGDDMRSPFDDDVEMEEACMDVDEVVGKVDKEEDAEMRDWTDEDVVMDEIT